MAKIVELPRLSDTMQEGAIARWHVAVGDKIKRGQVIAEIETDKATMEFESFDAGTVLKLVVEEGETLPLGAPIAVLGEPGEDAESALGEFSGASAGGTAKGKKDAGKGSKKGAGKADKKEDKKDEGKAKRDQAKAKAKGGAQENDDVEEDPKAPAASGKARRNDKDARGQQEDETEDDGDERTEDEAEQDSDEHVRDDEAGDEAPQQDARSGRIPASPLARRLAREHGISLSSIRGSGPHGRVVKVDVEAAVTREGAGKAAGKVPAEGTPTDAADEAGRPYVSRPAREETLTQMRKAIARRMGESFRDTPHFYLTASIGMDRIARLRSEYNEAISGTKISINDVLILAAAKALREHPRVNSYFARDRIVRQGDVHIGVAVALPDGLVVPVIRYADQKTLRAISMETRDFGKRAKKRELKPSEMTGSTFTISNLGMFGIDHFSAVINPGEGAILAVGKIDTVVKVDEAGQFVPRKQMTVTIACDHRAMDGADGASFLATLKRFLETPMALFA